MSREARRFPAVTLESWKAEARTTLGESASEDSWAHALGDGVRIQPLYSQETTPAADAFASFARGPASDGPALTLPRYEPSGLPELAEQIADDSRGGVHSFWIRSGAGGVVQTAADLRRALPTDSTTGGVLAWDAGPDALAAAALVECTAASDSWPPPPRRVAFADPLGTLAASGALPRSLVEIDRETVALASHAASRSDDVALVISTEPYHMAGARPAQEIGCALASGLAQLRVLMAGGLSAASAAGQIGFSVVVGREHFPEIAKLRALRVAWARVLAAHGVAAGPAWVHAVTSERTLSRRDPWVNALRVTGQVFAALAGGAQAVTPAAFDAAGAQPGAEGRRLARNTVEILRDECAVGDVSDPAGGAYLVESLTDDIGRAGWRFFRTVEEQGGMLSALQTGWLQTTLADAWTSHCADVEAGSTAITGVTHFVDATDVPLAAPVPAPSGSPADSRAETPARQVVPDLPPAPGTPPADLFRAMVEAARHGATLADLVAALSRRDGDTPPAVTRLPRHRDAEPFEAVAPARAESVS